MTHLRRKPLLHPHWPKLYTDSGWKRTGWFGIQLHSRRSLIYSKDAQRYFPLHGAHGRKASRQSRNRTRTYPYLKSSSGGSSSKGSKHDRIIACKQRLCCCKFLLLAYHCRRKHCHGFLLFRHWYRRKYCRSLQTATLSRCCDLTGVWPSSFSSQTQVYLPCTSSRCRSRFGRWGCHWIRCLPGASPWHYSFYWLLQRSLKWFMGRPGTNTQCESETLASIWSN